MYVPLFVAPTTAWVHGASTSELHAPTDAAGPAYDQDPGAKCAVTTSAGVASCPVTRYWTVTPSASSSAGTAESITSEPRPGPSSVTCWKVCSELASSAAFAGYATLRAKAWSTVIGAVALLPLTGVTV